MGGCICTLRLDNCPSGPCPDCHRPTAVDGILWSNYSNNGNAVYLHKIPRLTTTHTAPCSLEVFINDILPTIGSGKILDGRLSDYADAADVVWPTETACLLQDGSLFHSIKFSQQRNINSTNSRLAMKLHPFL